MRFESVSRIGGVLGLMLFVFACGGGGGDQGSSETAGPGSPPASASTPPGSPSAVSKDNPCSVMFPTEVGDILGRPSELREVVDEVTCRYHFEPEPGAASASASDETFIEVKVHWTDGRTAVMATRLAGQLLGGDSSGFEKLSGVGDEAWLAPLASYLSFSKGDVGVEIDMRMMPGEREKAIKLAQLIAGRI